MYIQDMFVTCHAHFSLNPQNHTLTVTVKGGGGEEVGGFEGPHTPVDETLSQKNKLLSYGNNIHETKELFWDPNLCIIFASILRALVHCH